jgi:hypothetical protein
MRDILERLRAYDRSPALWNARLREAGEAADEIERLRSHNAALVETVRASLCPYNGRTTGVTVGECQQCGCTSGLMIKPE